MVVKIILKKIYENKLWFLIAMFVFLIFPSFVSAINYGEGLYNYGVYSANTPTGGHPPLLPSVTPPISETVNCAPSEIFSPTTGMRCTNFTVTTPVGCTATTFFSPISGQRCPAVNISTPTPTSYNFGTATLRNGSEGEAVKELQRFFNDTLNANLVVDGKLGPKTIAVVKKWQKDNNLVVDGLLGITTKAKMNAVAQSVLL
jgi:hypothetical protein